jgi:hypothetical protein
MRVIAETKKARVNGNMETFWLCANGNMGREETQTIIEE